MFKKLGSFTIIELVVAMLISSIVVVIIYYTYFLFNIQFNRQYDKARTTGDFFLLRSALQKDFDEADAIIDSAGILLIARPGAGIIRYEAGKKNIARQTGLGIDSFALDSEGWITKTADDKVSLVKQAAIYIRIGNEAFTAMFTKRYSSTQLMEAENNQGE